MKYPTLSLLIATFCSLTMSATSITADDARAVAQQFITRSAIHKAPGRPGALQLAHTATSARGESDYYVFNLGTDGGFVIVGGDDQAPAVWGYSDHGSFNPAQLPDNARWWLGEYQHQLQWLRDHPETKPRKATNLDKNVEPLLTTTWNQDVPYNNMCPAIPEEFSNFFYGNHACTGCVPTATAQIMKYYNWPHKGDCFNSYTYPVYYDSQTKSDPITLRADFGSTIYDWEQMMDDYDYRSDGNVYCRNSGTGRVLATQAQQDAVAQLMSHVGIAINVVYGSSQVGSSGSVGTAMRAMTHFFRYDKSMRYEDAYDYSDDEWKALLVNELAENRPILYSGRSSSAGHAFIIDGCNNEGYFHINWGWGGYCDGNFLLGLFNPYGTADEGYNGSQSALIGIKPDYSNTGTTPYPVMLADVNCDGTYDIDDVNLVINHMVKKGQLSERQLANADSNHDGDIDIDDLNTIINIMVGKSSAHKTEFKTHTVGGISFKMAKVKGGTFLMGSTAEQGFYFAEDETPVHEVTLSDYYIGETEVTQELWEAVMGSNPSYFSPREDYAANPKHPVECVGWDDCQSFIAKLNALTGENFRLPTEAEWEYAARGGVKSKGYKYAGGNSIYDVAWYWGNAYMSGSDSNNGTHTVATTAPNELGLYDMSGNVWEWCGDWYGDYDTDPQINPTGPATGTHRVHRGGSWYDREQYCRTSSRDLCFDSYFYWHDYILGMRLAASVMKLSTTHVNLNTGESANVTIERGSGNYQVHSSNNNVATAKIKNGSNHQVVINAVGAGYATITVTDATTGERTDIGVAVASKYVVNGVAFVMVSVEGGTFTMGATDEQRRYYTDELPIHQVTLSDYRIGQTEVTQALWQAVMGSNPSFIKGDPQLPVECITWDDAQEFITKLNAITGEHFRLPTEAEWEFAARGGNKSHHFQYAGSNDLDEVAWYSANAGDGTHVVGTKAPNELNLYDMSGNVMEWCQDWYEAYNSSAATNPTGPDTGSYKTRRGGSWRFEPVQCRVSCRILYGSPSSRGDSLGFRLAL